MTVLVHPNLPGREIDVDDASAPYHLKAGWQPKTEQPPSEDPSANAPKE